MTFVGLLFKEKPFLLPGSCDHERPADILIPNYSAGKDLAVDFAVTCPLQSAYLHEAANTSLKFMPAISMLRI